MEFRIVCPVYVNGVMRILVAKRSFCERSCAAANDLIIIQVKEQRLLQTHSLVE